tara:strand:- start:2313 stop:3752 length:1440 start_codon:yes stop_codon:yes gene_type:complete
MKLIFIWGFFVFCSLSNCAQSEKNQSGCLIEFKNKSYKNKTFYLASHYGKFQTLIDSVNGDSDGRLIFKKNKKYVGGIYMLVNNTKEIEIEFLMDEKQQFKIEPDTQNSSKTAIYQSPINIDFRDFNLFLKAKQLQIELLKPRLETAENKAEIIVFQKKIESIKNEINQYKQNYISSHTNTLALLFKLTQPIDDFSSLKRYQKLLTNEDSISYLKNNYFKGINFKDSRLLRNPFLESKLSSYFEVFVPKTVEAITEEITKILDAANTPKDETFKYLSLYFMDLYINPKIMGYDRIFINLYNTYFKTQTYDWLTLTQKELFKSKARLLEYNQIGSKARELFMNSIDGNSLNLYELKSNYIVLIFWDPTCGHCQSEIPRINNLYQNNWGKIDVSIYAVNMNSKVQNEWREFIKNHNLNRWNHVSPSAVVNGDYSQKDIDYKTLYNIGQTPVYYLLDKSKTIIAKDIDPKDYIKFIDRQRIN